MQLSERLSLEQADEPEFVQLGVADQQGHWEYFILPASDMTLLGRAIDELVG